MLFPNHVPNLAPKNPAEAHGSHTIRCHHPDGTCLVEQANAPGAAAWVPWVVQVNWFTMGFKWDFIGFNMGLCMQFDIP
jgi:hypothetical protein